MSKYPGQGVQKELTRIKGLIKEAHDGFQSNYDLFNEFRRFIYKSSLTAGDLSMLEGIGRPALEFNILPAYISRLLGEFSKQEPSLEVISDDPNKVNPQMLQICNDHLAYMFNDSTNEHIRYNLYKDMLTGGWGVAHVMTEYANEMSMDQIIKIHVVPDPTLCYFDLLAREPDKSDGRFCGINYVWSKEEFQQKYPDVDLKGTANSAEIEGFKWTYQNGIKDVMIISDFYEKEYRKEKLVRLSNNETMTKDKYEEMLSTWQEKHGMYELPPTIVASRTTNVPKIVRYRLMATQILEYEETDFPGLPLVFFKGSGTLIKDEGSGEVKEMCLPYLYHAKDAQRLKNFAGISLANELENVLQHKFAVAMEALPTQQPDWLEAYANVQKANTLVYKSRYDDNPDMIIPNPIMPLPRIGAPPEIMNAFQAVDSTIQMELGSYDAALGINKNQLSGIAVVEAATQSNAAAMPYVVGFMQGLQRVGQIIVELLPKYIVTPRTLPMRNSKGDRYYVQVNQGNDPTFDYESNCLQVHAHAGASFAVQKSRMLMQIKEMMGMSPIFAQFISTKGLDFVLENMEGKGIEELKEQVDQFVKQTEAMQQQQMQAQQQEAMQNPALMRNQIDQQKLQLDAQKMQMEHKIDMLKLQLEEKKLTADMAIAHDKNQVEMHKAKDSLHVEHLKLAADQMRDHADLALESHDQLHRHAKENEELKQNKEQKHASKSAKPVKGKK